MRIVQIVLLAIISGSFLQTGDIFKAVENNDKKTVLKWLKTAKDLDVVNEDGQSVLIKAVQSKNSSLVYRLLKNGVQVDQVDSFGKTALDYAVELGNKKIAIMLIKSNARVTTESNSIKCKELINSGRGWRIFAAIALSIVGIYLIASTLLIGLMCTCLTAYGISNSVIPLIIGGAIFLVVSGGLIYGSVKLGKKKPYDLCDVRVV